jgi:hypothetical protein
VNDPIAENKKLQGMGTEEFFYFFLRMRKGEVRRIVGLLQTRYPNESPEQLAERLIASKSRLALLGGTLLNLPALMPGVGSSLTLAGVVGATSLLTRMNLYLINEIALVFGEDIDDTARIGDMMAVAGATAISSAAPSFVGKYLGLSPWTLLPAGALSSAAATNMIGYAAIRHFRGKASERQAYSE